MREVSSISKYNIYMGVIVIVGGALVSTTPRLYTASYILRLQEKTWDDSYLDNYNAKRIL